MRTYTAWNPFCFCSKVLVANQVAYASVIGVATEATSVGGVTSWAEADGISKEWFFKAFVSAFTKSMKASKPIFWIKNFIRALWRELRSPWRSKTRKTDSMNGITSFSARNSWATWASIGWAPKPPPTTTLKPRVPSTILGIKPISCK